MFNAELEIVGTPLHELVHSFELVASECGRQDFAHILPLFVPHVGESSIPDAPPCCWTASVCELFKMFDGHLFDGLGVATYQRWVGAHEAIVEAVNFAQRLVKFELEYRLGHDERVVRCAEPGYGRGGVNAPRGPVAELAFVVADLLGLVQTRDICLMN